MNAVAGPPGWVGFSELAGKGESGSFLKKKKPKKNFYFVGVSGGTLGDPALPLRGRGLLVSGVVLQDVQPGVPVAEEADAVGTHQNVAGLRRKGIAGPRIDDPRRRRRHVTGNLARLVLVCGYRTPANPALW